MAGGRASSGLRWFFLLLLAELVLFGVIYFLRSGSTSGSNEANNRPPSFSREQTLNLQSLINAKGYSCPQPPALRYGQRRSQRVIIIATCRQGNGDTRSFEIDFKGAVRPR
jgi:hypothetical protein